MLGHTWKLLNVNKRKIIICTITILKEVIVSVETGYRKPILLRIFSVPGISETFGTVGMIAVTSRVISARC